MVGLTDPLEAYLALRRNWRNAKTRKIKSVTFVPFILMSLPETDLGINLNNALSDSIFSRITVGYTYTLQRPCATVNWLSDTIFVGLLVLVVIGMTEKEINFEHGQ